MTVSFAESWLFELAAVEQGAIIQNLGLMSQAHRLDPDFYSRHYRPETIDDIEVLP